LGRSGRSGLPMLRADAHMSAPTIIKSSDAPAPLDGFAQGVQAGPFIFISGQLPTDFVDGLSADARVTPGLPFYTVPMKLQTAAVLKRMQALLKQGGSGSEQAVCIWSFIADITQAAYSREERARYFRGACASTAVIVKSLPVIDALIEMDLICVANDAPCRPEPINTDRAPMPPAGRYPQAVRVGPYIFTAGQIPTDFNRTIAPSASVDPNFPFFGRSIKKQTAYILENIKAVLEAAESSLDHVVKAHIFLKDAGDFLGLDEVWRDYFKSDPPARTVVPAETLFPGALLEIQTIAVTADGAVRKEVVHTARAPQPTIHQSQAIKAGDFVFLSGLMSTDYRSAVAPEAAIDPVFPNHASAIQWQTDYIFRSAAAILDAAGSSLDNLVRWQAFLPDASDVAVFQQTARSCLGATAPWPTMAQTTELLIPSCRVLVDLTTAA
jgi:reactive intermediate/imine deaminase